MALFYAVVFALALLGILKLFALKYWELKHERLFMPNLRKAADRKAEQLKELSIAARADLEKLPPETARLTRVLLHKGALGLAALARAGEEGAHRLADFVSHKRGFERKATSSEFLKKVAEHREDGRLDTTENEGHNS